MDAEFAAPVSLEEVQYAQVATEVAGAVTALEMLQRHPFAYDRAAHFQPELRELFGAASDRSASAREERLLAQVAGAKVGGRSMRIRRTFRVDFSGRTLNAIFQELKSREATVALATELVEVEKGDAARRRAVTDADAFSDEQVLPEMYVCFSGSGRMRFAATSRRLNAFLPLPEISIALQTEIATLKKEKALPWIGSSREAEESCGETSPWPARSHDTSDADADDPPVDGDPTGGQKELD
eukprot:scaffold334_cov241-Pinguiococcus_pyrenoidosus.AAC.61